MDPMGKTHDSRMTHLVVFLSSRTGKGNASGSNVEMEAVIEKAVIFQLKV